MFGQCDLGKKKLVSKTAHQVERDFGLLNGRDRYRKGTPCDTCVVHKDVKMTKFRVKVIVGGLRSEDLVMSELVTYGRLRLLQRKLGYGLSPCVEIARADR